jgi:hypothetical protein
MVYLVHWPPSFKVHINELGPRGISDRLLITAMVKMFHLRRSPDSAQKKQIFESSKDVAIIMVKHLSSANFGELYHNVLRQILMLFR